MKIKTILRYGISFFIAGFIVPYYAYCQENVAALASPQLFNSELTTAKKLLDLLVEFCVKYSFQVVGGVLIFALGFFAAKIIAGFLKRFLKKKNVDVTVAKFMVNITRLIVIAFFALIALGKFGITIAPFIAGLSVIGFGTSFALQGPLSNYAAGLTLIFTKPFKVADIIEITGVMGEVEDMTLARTLLRTVEGTLIVIPNKHIIGEVIHNFSTSKKLDITIGVSYGTDIDHALKVVGEIIARQDTIIGDPTPKIGIAEFADSSITLCARMWCKQADYFDLMFAINKDIYETFKKENIAIPFPQRDVHIIKEITTSERGLG